MLSNFPATQKPEIGTISAEKRPIETTLGLLVDMTEDTFQLISTIVGDNQLAFPAG